MLACAMEEESGGGEKVAKRREEKARVREKIAKENLHDYKFALAVSWFFFFFFLLFFVFFGRTEEFGTKPLSLP